MKNQNNRTLRGGFTLIELLVVIAIIAILAAILFPVFAQAREKARQTSCLSNMKQISLGVTQYVQDYDESFPTAFEPHPTGTGGPDWGRTWAEVVDPYLKSSGVYVCPSDGTGGEVQQSISFAGGNAGYAGNSYYKYGWLNPGIPFRGIFSYYSPNDNWLELRVRTLGDISRPAEAIMIGEKHSDDNENFVACWDSTWKIGNRYGFGPNSVFMGVWDVNACFGHHWVPDGARPAAAYPRGKNGAVSVHGSGLSNFAFADGHVKAMKPEQTNPDENNRQDLNMWDVTRK